MLVLIMSSLLWLTPANDLGQSVLDQSGKFTMVDDYNDASLDACLASDQYESCD